MQTAQREPAHSARHWSEQQEAIFRWFASGSGNLVVKARAGTGKTTTAIEATSRAPERRILLAAFNKKIAVELAGRITNPACVAKTLHALGFGFIRAQRSQLRVDNAQGYVNAAEVCKAAPDDLIGDVAKLAARVKATSCPTGSTPARRPTANTSPSLAQRASSSGSRARRRIDARSN